MKIGDKVKLIREDHWTKEDNLSLGQIYEIKSLSFDSTDSGYRLVKLVRKRFTHYRTNFEEIDVDEQPDPPVSIQWDGECFTIDSIRINPLELKKILECYVFDEKGECSTSSSNPYFFSVRGDDYIEECKVQKNGIKIGSATCQECENCIGYDFKKCWIKCKCISAAIQH